MSSPRSVRQEAASPAQNSAGLPLWPWVCIVLLACIDAAWILLTPLSLDPSSGRFIATLAPLVVSSIVLARYRRYSPRIHVLLTGMAFMLAAWPVLRLFNHLTTTIAFPLADARLSRWDETIGFDWFAYVHWVDRHPQLLEAMRVTYTSLTGYTCLLFMLLALVGPQPQRRCAELIELFVATALICMITGVAFPALAPMAYHAPPPGTFAHLDMRTGTSHVAYLIDLRDNPSHVFNLSRLPGLVTLPSFHTAMGLIAIYCARGSLWLFLPMLAINLLMIGSTPVFGSHYGIDIVAGALVTLWAIMAQRARDFRRTRTARPASAGAAVLAPPAQSALAGGG